MARNIINAKDFAKMLKITELVRNQQTDVLEKAYLAAVETEDEELAANAVRAYRNKLLDESDKMMVQDRPIENVQEWRNYRQSLRDVPEQEGFPFDVEFPVQP